MHSPHTQHAACKQTVRQTGTQTDRETGRRNGHTVETGHNGGLTAITSIVIWTPDGGKTNPQKGEGGNKRKGGGEEAGEKTRHITGRGRGRREERESEKGSRETPN